MYILVKTLSYFETKWVNRHVGFRILIGGALLGTGTGARSPGGQGPRQYQEARQREARSGRNLSVEGGQGASARREYNKDISYSESKALSTIV